MTDWRHTKSAWARLKLSLAEYLVLTCIEQGIGYRSPPKNICLVDVADEIKTLRETHFPKETP